MITAKLTAGLRSTPFLADHGFRDMVVLPGSYYLAEAARIYLERLNRVLGTIRDVRFVTPALLSEEDMPIGVEVRAMPESCAFEFCQIESGGSPAPLLASLKIEEARPAEAEERVTDFSVENFQERSGAALEMPEFYQRLRQNGNQYGPRFQILQKIWRHGAQGLGLLQVDPALDAGSAPLHPVLLDACTQLLAALVLEKGKTFVLKSIDALHIHSLALPEKSWAWAELQTPAAGAEENGFTGAVRVFDATGKLSLHFSGVSCAFLEAAPEEKKETPALKLCLASTFTAEPIEDSLKFWGERLSRPVQVEFAPYNQVFQQFLDPASLFHRNSDGVNIILLNLEDWARGEAKSELKIDHERVDRTFENQPRYALPNGLEIVHLNRHETDYVFEEIFTDQSYLKHGIRLRDEDTVIDIGANIGLFSLFVASSCQNPTIYAFEPSPAAFARLQMNGAAYIPSFHAFNCGVADRRKTARFTFYEKSSVFSSFFSDEMEDRAAIQAVARNILGGVESDEPSVEEDVRELTADRLRHTIHECPLLSVSDIIRENGLKKIDLLKIDAEKSEWDILSGIGEEDWAMIQQIVIEIHDRTGTMAGRVERLLTEKGFQCAVEQEKLLEESGLFNIYAIRHEGQVTLTKNIEKTTLTRTSLAKNVDEFHQALTAFIEESRVPMILCITPRTVPSENSVFEEAELDLLQRVSHLRKVQSIGSKYLLDHYPVENLHDVHSHQLAHIPYSPEGYVALGTALFRKLFHRQSRPFKVIALDCDNTLWRGECGEDGPRGLLVTEAHQRLQEFMLGQMNAGLLLCLCSRNNEEDVWNVFAQREDMTLRREHLTAGKINWARKSDNLRALAAELNLGLDSFIFIDDNPVECAEVKAACPEVLTLTLPREEEAISPFLNHIWAFDHTSVTSEDQSRTSFYRENVSREKLAKQALSLKDFIDGLELRVEIAPATLDQVTRISQLTFRTNQFNLTTIRRSEEEITALLQEKNVRSLVTAVSDRFGDYGLVSVLLYRVEDNRLVVDTFLLSCRALGRGVEYRILSELGRLARAEGKAWIEMTYQMTEKNQPARDFMTSIGSLYKINGTLHTTYRFPVEFLASLRYNPDAGTSPRRSLSAEKEVRMRQTAPTYPSDYLQEIGTELCDVPRIARAMSRSKQPINTLAASSSGNHLETALLNIWQRVLGRSDVGLNDNFFEAGGTSLKAVLIVAEMRRELNRPLSIIMLFECPTIKLLAARLDPSMESFIAPVGISSAESRGQMRRIKVVKRKSAVT